LFIFSLSELFDDEQALISDSLTIGESDADSVRAADLYNPAKETIIRSYEEIYDYLVEYQNLNYGCPDVGQQL
ncbi:MAG: hypothetical protein N2Z65_07430, partial [Clostridiales bacterium]|nr:hypothetical protein [Clostridiales bacterium]